MGKKAVAGSAVSSFTELHARLSRYNEDWIFRGHADVRWELIPKVGRGLYVGNERNLFESWKRRAAEHAAAHFASDWDLIAIAQHHGLATRLLDWTANPLNAAYFAVREPVKRKGPAEIFAVRFEDSFDKSAETTAIDPLTFEGIAMFRPRGVVPRIVRQGGLFTIHGPPELSLETVSRDAKAATLERIVIEESYRPTLLAELARYGIHAASLFPDLDGIANFLNWSAERGVFLN